MNNKFTTYLLYSIGEIFLVVVGILIAVQIDDWNSSIKTSESELEVLKSITAGLEQDREDLLSNSQTISESIEASNILLEMIEQNMKYDESIPTYFGIAMTNPKFMYSMSAFETLKAKGITLVENDELRDLIISVFDSRYRFFVEEENRVLDYKYHGLDRIYPTRFEESFVYDLSKPGYAPRLVPLDFNQLKSDQEFLYFFKSHKNKQIILLDYHYAGIIKQVDLLITALEVEIGKIKNS